MASGDKQTIFKILQTIIEKHKSVDFGHLFHNRSLIKLESEIEWNFFQFKFMYDQKKSRFSSTNIYNANSSIYVQF
jgi:hypothetical protein